MPDVVVNLQDLNQFTQQVSSDLRNRSNGPVRAAIHQWGFIYRTFLKERFTSNARGGGDWKGLAPSTIRKRRKGRGKSGNPAILWDKGGFIGAFNPTFSRKPGQLQKDIPFGVRVGIGGAGKASGGRKTLQTIAEFHQRGMGHNPKRELIVVPDARTINKMAEVMQRAINKMKK